MKLALSEIKAPNRKARDHEALSSLRESIAEVGLIEPIILNERNEVISGRRRYFAAKELKLTHVEVEYFKKPAVDVELAAIDANLMVLPLGSADYDIAISRRKKLYLQKHPETKQYTAKSEETAPFTKDVADVLGITRRSVELAVARAEKASPKVTELRREGKLSPTVVNALIRMPTTYQDKFLPFIDGKSTHEVKKYVDLALEKDVDFAIARIGKYGEKYTALEQVDKSLDKLSEALTTSFASRAKVDLPTIKPILEKTNEIISLLEKFIEVNTPVHKPILRKHHQIAS